MRVPKKSEKKNEGLSYLSENLNRNEREGIARGEKESEANAQAYEPEDEFQEAREEYGSENLDESERGLDRGA